jgi:hypothetical protein
MNIQPFVKKRPLNTILPNQSQSMDRRKLKMQVQENIRQIQELLKQGKTREANQLASKTDSLSRMLVLGQPGELCTGQKYNPRKTHERLPGGARIDFPDGRVYMGDTNSEGIPHGRGIMVYPDGRQVSGNWENGRLINEEQQSEGWGAWLYRQGGNVINLISAVSQLTSAASQINQALTPVPTGRTLFVGTPVSGNEMNNIIHSDTVNMLHGNYHPPTIDTFIRPEMKRPCTLQ